MRHPLNRSFRMRNDLFTFTLFFLALFIRIAIANEKRTKLCADPECKNDLFPSHVTRPYDSVDSIFLNTKQDEPVKVVAFRLSNRPDLMEAQSSDGKRGFIYSGHIDLMPFVIFLESAIKTNQTLYMVEQMGEWPKLISEISAIPDLKREYMIYANKFEDYQLDKRVVDILLKYDEETEKRNLKKNHGNSHHHDHGHGKNDETKKKDGDGEKTEKLAKAVKNEVEHGTSEKDIAKPDPITSEGAQTITEKSPIIELKDDMNTVSENMVKEAVGTSEEQPAANHIEKEVKNTKEEEKLREIEKEDSLKPKVNAEVKEVPTPEGLQNNLPTEDNVKVDSVQHIPKQQTEQQTDSSKQSLPSEKNLPTPVQQVPQKNSPLQQSLPSEQTPPPTPPPTSEKNQHQISPQQSPSSQKLPLASSSMEQQPSNDPIDQIKHEKLLDEGPPTKQLPPLRRNLIHHDPILKKLKSVGGATQPPQPKEHQQQSKDGSDRAKTVEETKMEEQKQEKQQETGRESASIPLQRAPHVDTDLPHQQVQQQPLDNIPDIPPMTQSDKNLGIPTEEESIRANIIDLSPQDGVVNPAIAANNDLTRKEREREEWERKSGDGSGSLQREEFAHINAQQQQGREGEADEMKKEKDNDAERNSEQKYCYKDDCPENERISPLDESSHTTISSSNSTFRLMYREWMHSVRSLLPDPLCHFEDTGLFILVFMLFSLVMHLLNKLFLSNSGPQPFDHRLLHDCITRLKEQEVIIEKSKNNAAVNQRLLEEAQAAEQLQKQNQTLDQRLKASERRNVELETENGKLKQSLNSSRHELDQVQTLNGELKASIESKDAQLKELQNAHKQIESELDETMGKLAQTQNRERYLEQDLKQANSQLEQFKRELTEAQREVEKWRNECAEKRAEIDELLGIVAELNSEGRGGGRDEERRKSSDGGGGGGKKKQNGEGKTAGSSSSNSSPGQPGSILDAVELDPDNGAGSGGSAGWSDLGDGMEITGATLEESSEKTMRTSSPIEGEVGKKSMEKAKRKSTTDESGSGGKLLDILEMAKLKSRLRSLETERDQTKLSLKVEREEKENMAKEVERLRQELVERERDSEQRELDRHGLTQQCTKLLQMIEEKEKKVEHSEQEREKLRARLSEVELELRKVDDERREVQHRLKELEQSLKQSRELNGRLENKLYHEERRLNAKIRQLEEQLTVAKTSLSPINISAGGVSSDLNMSGNSSDRDFVPLNSPEGIAGERSAVPSLWSEIDAAEPVDELVSMERKGATNTRRRSMRTSRGMLSGAEDSRDSPFLNDIVHVNKSGREEYHNPLNTSKLSGAASVHSGHRYDSGIATPRQRMRSRSAGRQSVARLTGIAAAAAANNPYGTIGGGALYSHHQRASVVPYQQSASGKNSPYRQQPERPLSAARLRNAIGAGMANTSATNYYSSDSASSPPPEMPLLSGVPPPGLQKRPAVIVPAPKLNIQLHKPMAAAPKMN